MVDCCRSAFAGGAAGTSQERMDWTLFLRLVQFHRVQGLVARGLPTARAVPQTISDSIGADALRIAAANLRASLECGRLVESSNDAGIDPLFVKGLTLGALAYGNPAIKFAVDIDILVRDAELETAAELLQREGYRLEEPPGPYSAERLRAWHEPGKESTWVRDEPWSVVDLHTRLSDNPRLISTIGPDSPRQLVEVAKGIELPTLQEEELFAYLCVHGASSAWFRLKWIADLAALLHRKTAEEVARLHRRSRELGAGRAADQALLLADVLFGTLSHNRGLRSKLQADRISRWLCRQALRQLAGRSEPVEPTARLGGTARIHLTQFLLMPGLGFKASELVRQARAALR